MTWRWSRILISLIYSPAWFCQYFGTSCRFQWCSPIISKIWGTTSRSRMLSSTIRIWVWLRQHCDAPIPSETPIISLAPLRSMADIIVAAVIHSILGIGDRQIIRIAWCGMPRLWCWLSANSVMIPYLSCRSNEAQDSICAMTSSPPGAVTATHQTQCLTITTQTTSTQRTWFRVWIGRCFTKGTLQQV